MFSNERFKYVSIHSLNLLRLIIGKTDESIEWSSTEEKIKINTFKHL